MTKMNLPESISEQTFISVKTDGIQRGLVGEIISRFERRGLKLVACKLTVQTKERVEQLYPNSKEWLEGTGKTTLAAWRKRGRATESMTPLEAGQWVRDKLVKDLVGKPIVAMVWQGANAVALGRKTVGITNPLEAAVGTIRGDFTVESYEVADALGHAARNLVHASGSVEEAKKDIAIYFKGDDFIDYTLSTEEVLYGD